MRRLIHRSSPWLVCAAALAAWATSSAHPPIKADFAGEPVSEVIFPAQSIPLRFSHVQHLKAAKLNCGFCHDAAEASKSSLDNHIPGEDTCETCHEIDRNQPDKQVGKGEPPADCRSCHPGFEKGQPVARVSIPNPNLKFNHAAHVDRKVRCQVCHGELDAEGVTLATTAQLPKMMLCLQCHDGREAPAACTTCHLAEGNGLMQTAFPEGMLRPSGVLRGDAHDLLFRTQHATAAKHDEAYCENCHRKEFCVGCHDGTMKPLDFHGNDYVTLHAVDARRNTPDCSACHRAQTFCVGCHSRSGVGFAYDPVAGQESKGGQFNAPTLTLDSTRRFHPEGWGSPTRGITHHSFEAQRNIKQCAACHRESFCTTCHSNNPFNPFGPAAGVCPHPANWAGSRRCEALAARAGRMCLRCHIDPAEVSCDWEAPSCD